MKDGIFVLGIESSCDETAASVVKNGRTVLSNIISSQIDIHEKFGGVVPEIASRNHIYSISSVADKALRDANISIEDLSAISVTYGPGLVGALLVGLSYAKGLAFSANKPLIGVNHIEGHIFANFIEYENLEPPFISLVVSGGHTHLVYIKDYETFEILGRTKDDAAGECFDKVARSIGLGYPGGPKVEKCALNGNPKAINFPKAMINEDNLDFSFSGLKSAVLNYLNKANMMKEAVNEADVAASFQQAVAEVLTFKSLEACKKYNVKKFALSGGVACNKAIQASIKTAMADNDIDFFVPNAVLCTDNAAMIACRGYYEFINGAKFNLNLNAYPNLAIGEKKYSNNA